MSLVEDRKKQYQYKVPTFFPLIFYGALTVWTLVSAYLLGEKALRAEWGNALQWFMISFVVAYTWYFSVGISYEISVDEDGKIELVSFRRKLRIMAAEVPEIEGPGLPFGFVKLRLEREKAYLFGILKSQDLLKVLATIRNANPEINIKNLILPR